MAEQNKIRKYITIRLWYSHVLCSNTSILHIFWELLIFYGWLVYSKFYASQIISYRSVKIRWWTLYIIFILPILCISIVVTCAKYAHVTKSQPFISVFIERSISTSNLLLYMIFTTKLASLQHLFSNDSVIWTIIKTINNYSTKTRTFM